MSDATIQTWAAVDGVVVSRMMVKLKWSFDALDEDRGDWRFSMGLCCTRVASSETGNSVNSALYRSIARQWM
jgi:hypothetical protein